MAIDCVIITNILIKNNISLKKKKVIVQLAIGCGTQKDGAINGELSILQEGKK